jgi:hypothetical protein
LDGNIFLKDENNKKITPDIAERQFEMQLVSAVVTETSVVDLCLAERLGSEKMGFRVTHRNLHKKSISSKVRPEAFVVGLPYY